MRKDGRTVGFLDDMRRLNVALSRAKKKLILIGNLRTLCSEYAHSEAIIGTNQGPSPVSVFRMLKTLQDKTAAKTSLDLLRQHVQEGSIRPGHVFKNCEWQYDTDFAVFPIIIGGDRRWFKLRKTPALAKYSKPSELIDVKFIGFGENDGRAQFEYLPDVPIARQITDGLIRNITGQLSEWLDENETQMIMEFEDGSSLALEIVSRDDFLRSILNGTTSLPLFITEGKKCSLDKRSYANFQRSHHEGQRVMMKIIDDKHPKYLVVECEGVFGKVIRNFPLRAVVGRSYPGTIYRMCDKYVVFNLDKR